MVNLFIVFLIACFSLYPPTLSTLRDLKRESYGIELLQAIGFVYVVEAKRSLVLVEGYIIYRADTMFSAKRMRRFSFFFFELGTNDNFCFKNKGFDTPRSHRT